MPELLQWPIDAVASLVDEGGPFVIGIFLCGLIMWAIVIEPLTPAATARVSNRATSFGKRVWFTVAMS